jgi:hypothetical protein
MYFNGGSVWESNAHGMLILKGFSPHALLVYCWSGLKIICMNPYPAMDYAIGITR